jgi:glycosyltransferase involved in cell wall biosynthesis
MMPLRVVIAAQHDPLSPRTWSGIPAGLAAGMRAHGVEVDGVSSSLGRNLDRILPIVVSGRRSARRAVDYGARMSRIRSVVTSQRMRRLAPDAVVQIGTGFCLDPALRVATFEDATVLQSTHAQPDRYTGVTDRVLLEWSERQRSIYRDVRACCCATEWTKQSIVNDYGIPSGKVHVTGFGRNLELTPVRRDWSTPRFLWIGRDWVRKNGQLVLDVFQEIRRDHPKAEIDFVGQHPSLRGREGVRGHGLLSIHEERGRERLRTLLEHATVFVMPSKFEPFGMVYVEAGAAGVASIGTTSGGAPEAVGDGGVVLDPHNRLALRSSMSMLADPVVAQELGRRAERHAAHFTWPAVAGRLLRAIDDDPQGSSSAEFIKRRERGFKHPGP